MLNKHYMIFEPWSDLVKGKGLPQQAELAQGVPGR